MRMTLARYNKASYWGTSVEALREHYKIEVSRDLNIVRVQPNYQTLIFEVEVSERQFKNITELKVLASRAGLYAQYLSRLAEIIQFTVEHTASRTIVVIGKANKEVITKYGRRFQELLKEVPDNVAEDVMSIYDKALETAYGYFPDKYKDLVPICIKNYIKTLRYPIKVE